MSTTQKAGPHHETGHPLNAATRDSTPSPHRSKITDQLDEFNAAWVAQGHPPIGYRTDVGANQLLPVGPPPDSCRLLLSGALWGSQKAVNNAATLVHPEDLDEPHRTIWAAICALAARGITGAQAVMDEIIRTGDASQSVRDELTQATTAGGVPEAIPFYCSQILAGQFRRAVESYGTGAVGWSATASEDELWELIVTGGTRLRGLHDRLTAARKGAGDADS
ncbi:hypothetical protein [Dietzia cinnamea]|uniref:hypothetical protein n=1 Tax=Dietzia cinnamea TaxID=321318 RepID=UPI00223BF749|nr:hypothetical protein [Dietzia cinnamea]MCT2076500.1 hypothetical protein [Dietzia cinnamea]MCT2220617.1 hypothetical protein [Dietzia cinnamea]